MILAAEIIGSLNKIKKYKAWRFRSNIYRYFFRDSVFLLWQFFAISRKILSWYKQWKHSYKTRHTYVLIRINYIVIDIGLIPAYKNNRRNNIILYNIVKMAITIKKKTKQKILAKLSKNIQTLSKQTPDPYILVSPSHKYAFSGTNFVFLALIL